MKRPCLQPGCPNLTEQTRCTVHARAKDAQRGTRAQRGYGPEWQRIASATVREHINQHGPVCPGYHRAPHASADLTADHVIPASRGGTAADGVRILCRGCNAARANVERVVR